MRLAPPFAALLLTASLSAAGAERVWQTGIWRDAKVVRPKVVFGVRPPTPGASAPPIVEVRTYVIETDDLRLELKENTTADARRIDAIIGAPVTFALEKDAVYIKQDDREHRLSVTKTTRKPRRTRPDTRDEITA